MSTKHIGIVGAGPEGAALFFGRVWHHAQRLLPPGQQPVLTLHNERLGAYLDAIQKHDWLAVSRLLVRSAEVLARAGAAFCVTPDQALIHAIHIAQASSPIPWVNPADLVAEAVQAAGQKVVGLVGTKLVMQSSTYQSILGIRGIRVEIPSEVECDRLDTIIFEELVYGHFKPESQAAVLQTVNALSRRGCEGVILGCSEAPLVVTSQNCTIRVYDAVDILAEQVVRLASAGG